MSLFKDFSDFTFDKNIPISRKLSLSIVVFFLLVFIDNSIGFTFFYYNNNKIETLEKLNNMIESNKYNNDVVKYCTELQIDIINKTNLLQRIYNLSQQLANYLYPQENHQRSSFWFFISSAGIFAFAIVILFILKITGKNVSFDSVISKTLTLTIFGYSILVVCSYIPNILDRYWITNYFVNFIIQIFAIYLMVELPTKGSQAPTNKANNIKKK